MADESNVIATRLRLVGATSIVLGFLTISVTMIFTQTADALMTGIWVALLCFGLPATSAIAAAYLVDVRARRSNADYMEKH